MRYFIFLSYNGKPYCGWQKQPQSPSVQETLEVALSTILRSPITIIGAGRTDTGVHAKTMVAHFNFEKGIDDLQKLVYKLNRFLPHQISIKKITPTTPEAHARFDATCRTYKYYLTLEKNPFKYEFAYYFSHRLDFNLMNQACLELLKYIDFTSFSKLHTDVKTNNCHIEKAFWKQEEDTWVFTISADRFLRNMVRAIVGTLLDVGRGKISIEEFRTIIESKDRGKASTSAPGHALFLVDISYPSNLFIL